MIAVMALILADCAPRRKCKLRAFCTEAQSHVAPAWASPDFPEFAELCCAVFISAAAQFFSELFTRSRRPSGRAGAMPAIPIAEYSTSILVAAIRVAMVNN